MEREINRDSPSAVPEENGTGTTWYKYPALYQFGLAVALKIWTATTEEEKKWEGSKVAIGWIIASPEIVAFLVESIIRFHLLALLKSFTTGFPLATNYFQLSADNHQCQSGTFLAFLDNQRD